MMLLVSPAYGSGHEHKIFSVIALQRDGYHLISLWKAFNRYYNLILAPKQYHPLLPPLIRQATSASKSQPDADFAKKNFWCLEQKSLITITSPYLLSCLLNAMIWIIPDDRYCFSEHNELWKQFIRLLLDALEVLSSSNQCAEAMIGDVSVLMPNILHQVFIRIQTSLFSFSPRAKAMSTLHINGANQSSFIVFIHYMPSYIELLYHVVISTLRFTSSPRVVNMIPQIWSFGLTLGLHTKRQEHQVHVCRCLILHLYDVIDLIQGAHKFRAAMKKEVIIFPFSLFWFCVLVVFTRTEC
jgi:hypothetical protein